MTAVSPALAGLIILAAFAHAAWNAVLKSSGDRVLALAMIIGIGAVAAVVAAPFVAFPPPAAWPYLAAAIVIHNVYYLFIIASYRDGDLSQVYPLARGIAPILVAGLAAVLAGETPDAIEFAAILFVSFGLCSLALSGGVPRGRAARAVLYALGTGVLVAAFTVVDGMGVRLSPGPFDFITWLMLLNAIPLLAWSLWLRRGRILVWVRAYGLPAAIGGAVSTAGLVVILYALGQGPMAHVAALRETSILFAAIIGAVRLREPFGARRIMGAAVVVGGLAALKAFAG
jgi:drug/metabolite transporter (DMT)-like permease